MVRLRVAHTNGMFQLSRQHSAACAQRVAPTFRCLFSPGTTSRQRTVDDVHSFLDSNPDDSLPKPAIDCLWLKAAG